MFACCRGHRHLVNSDNEDYADNDMEDESHGPFDPGNTRGDPLSAYYLLPDDFDFLRTQTFSDVLRCSSPVPEIINQIDDKVTASFPLNEFGVDREVSYSSIQVAVEADLSMQFKGKEESNPRGKAT